MNRIDRLIAILTTLQSKRNVTTQFIADKYEISERTVYRDLKALGEIGVPINFENDKRIFYSSRILSTTYFIDKRRSKFINTHLKTI